MRNSRVLRESLGALPFICGCGLFAGLLAQPMFATDKPPSPPPPFACEVRYHFREEFRHAKPGEKRFSAPSFEREGLPMSHVGIANGLAARIVEGRVAHLPYHFLVKVIQNSGTKPGTLEVNIVDNSGKAVAGFPQVMPNPLTRTGDTSRQEFEIPIDQALKKKIEKALLAKGQFLTHVDLIIGTDDDFLSADFPK